MLCISPCIAKKRGVTTATKETTRQPSRRDMHEQLISRIEQAFCLVNQALYRYTDKLEYDVSAYNVCTCSAEIKRIASDQDKLYRYMKQAATGDPALSRDELQQRIAEIDRMIQTWNHEYEGTV